MTPLVNFLILFSLTAVAVWLRLRYRRRPPQPLRFPRQLSGDGWAHQDRDVERLHAELAAMRDISVGRRPRWQTRR